MILLFIFWAITYLICSVHFKNATEIRIPHNNFGKMMIKFIKFFRNIYSKFSFQILLNTLDYIKCPLFVISSAFLFQKKYITDLTAIVSYSAHCFPIWHGFTSKNKNFLSIIFTGFILDPITGISMIFAFLLSARSFGYTSVAITSSMLVGMIKTLIHIIFFKNHDYVEAIFFIFFGCLAIYKNRKVLLYICEKTVEKDIPFYKKSKSNNISNKKSKELISNGVMKIAEKADKYYNKIQKNKIYKNYKKFYQNNKKFEENDRKYKN